MSFKSSPTCIPNSTGLSGASDSGGAVVPSNLRPRPNGSVNNAPPVIAAPNAVG